MTEHPLTDEVIEEIAHSGYIDDYGRYNYAANDLRAAADWQLEQMVEWLKGNLGSGFYLERYWDGDSEIDVDYVIKDLREAMRPTTTTPTETP